MKHSCETFANGVLEALGAYQGTGALENNARIVPGLYPSWDTANGTVTLNHEAGPENLCRLEAKVAGQPEWLTLNLDLGDGSFEAGAVIGIVADVAGGSDLSLQMFIRTSAEQGGVDTGLTERLPVSASRRVVTVLHTVGADDGVAATDRFHTLAIRLPRHDFRLEIHDMHFFILPADKGLRPHAMTLASSPA